MIFMMNFIEIFAQMRTPLPSKVRIWKKSLDHSKTKLAIGKFNPSGTGSRAYHEKNVATLEKLMLQYGYLLDMYRMPTKEEKYY